MSDATEYMDDNDWGTLVASIEDQQCVVFLGAGASTVLEGEKGLPTGGALSEMLANECKYPGIDKRDFLRVCQYYELVRDGHRLRRSIIQKLDQPNLKPGVLHNLIAELPFQYVLSTNYDLMMEEAFRQKGKNPTVLVYDISADSTSGELLASETNPLIYMLHGTLKKANSMLCTEDDIVQFLACVMLGAPPLLKGLKQLFENHTILFVGYGLKDWNIRAMIRALRGTKRSKDIDYVRSFALQRYFEASEAADWNQSVMYWNRKENVHCMNVDAIGFFEELAKRFHEARANQVLQVAS